MQTVTKHRESRRLALAIGCLAFGISACGADALPRNVILISIDTLRADRLGTYGYERDTSPSLDAFARRGAVVERVVSETSWTLPAHVTMLTGLGPATHGVVGPIKRIADETPLLGEVLREAGARTIGLTEGGYMAANFGFDRGFDLFDDAPVGLRKNLERTREFIEERTSDEPYFAFVQTYHVHCPYHPAASMARYFRSPDAEFIETERRCDLYFNRLDLTPGQVRYLSDQYDRTIREMDTMLGSFFDWLDARQELEDTVVVITSDHGEAFGEHGEIGHSWSVDREVLLIPLVIVGAGIGANRLPGPVGLADLVPTLTDLLGLPPIAGVEGRSLAPHLRGEPSQVPLPEERFSEITWKGSLYSVMTDDHQLILDVEKGDTRLISLGEDSQVPPEVRARLESLVEDYRKRRRVTDTPALDEVSPVIRERLRALGYLE